MATSVRIWSGGGCQGPRRQIHANAKYRVTDHALQSCDIGLGRPRLWDSHVHPWHHHEIGQDEHHQCEDQRLGDTGLKQPPVAPNRDEQQPVGNADDVVEGPNACSLGTGFTYPRLVWAKLPPAIGPCARLSALHQHAPMPF